MKEYFRNILLAIRGRNPLQEELDAALRRECSMQRLVENLRERVREKDAELEQQGREFRDRMEQVKRDYQQRIKEYNDKLEAINKELKR